MHGDACPGNFGLEVIEAELFFAPNMGPEFSCLASFKTERLRPSGFPLLWSNWTMVVALTATAYSRLSERTGGNARRDGPAKSFEGPAQALS